jgi:hypothetical protein
MNCREVVNSLFIDVGCEEIFELRGVTDGARRILLSINIKVRSCQAPGERSYSAGHLLHELPEHPLSCVTHLGTVVVPGVYRI